MLTRNDDYKLKDPINIQKYEDALSNKLVCAKKFFHPSLDGLLSKFKKVFGVTPMALKSASTQDGEDL